MKCFYCNAWRDLEVLEAHGPCLTGLKHVFVYSEPWPPFSDHTPRSPQQAMVITVGRSQEMEEHVDVENPDISFTEQDIKAVNPEILMEQQMSEEDQSVVQLDELEDRDEPEDVKPNLINSSKWVSIGDIRKWTSCIRCGMVRTKNKKKGWISHAQKCGQNPNYSTRKFFMHLHTVSWCGTLVMDTFWDSHSDPEKGSCAVCRVSRKQKVPLPFQPKPPARKNELSLQKQHQSRLIMKRKKRRETLAMDAQIRNASANNTLKIVGCTSLRR